MAREVSERREEAHLRTNDGYARPNMSERGGRDAGVEWGGRGGELERRERTAHWRTLVDQKGVATAASQKVLNRNRTLQSGVLDESLSEGGL